MKDHLLVLSKYSRLGASSRLRTLQYRRWLEDAGFAVEYSALFDDRYLQRLYSGEKTHADLSRVLSQAVFTVEADTSAQIDLGRV